MPGLVIEGHDLSEALDALDALDMAANGSIEEGTKKTGNPWNRWVSGLSAWSG